MKPFRPDFPSLSPKMLNSSSAATEGFKLDEYFLHLPGSRISHSKVELLGKMKPRPQPVLKFLLGALPSCSQWRNIGT